MSVLTNMLERPVAFQRAFVRLGIGVTGALLLSQLVYWHNRTEKTWFYKTRAEIEDETGLTRTEQETARKRLVQIGVLEEKLMSTPAKMHFRINEIQLEEALSKSCVAIHQKPESLNEQEPCQQDCSNSANKKAGIEQSSLHGSNQQVGINPTSKNADISPTSL